MINTLSWQKSIIPYWPSGTRIEWIWLQNMVNQSYSRTANRGHFRRTPLACSLWRLLRFSTRAMRRSARPICSSKSLDCSRFQDFRWILFRFKHQNTSKYHWKQKHTLYYTLTGCNPRTNGRISFKKQQKSAHASLNDMRVYRFAVGCWVLASILKNSFMSSSYFLGLQSFYASNKQHTFLWFLFRFLFSLSEHIWIARSWAIFARRGIAWNSAEHLVEAERNCLDALLYFVSSPPAGLTSIAQSTFQARNILK